MHVEIFCFLSLNQYFCNVCVLVADTITIDGVFISQVLQLTTASPMSQVPRRVFLVSEEWEPWLLL